MRSQFCGGLLAGALLLATTIGARAVLVVDTGTYETTDPSWTVKGTTTSAWDYVGTVNGCSAVYLGNGWAISAAHVGVTTGSTYTLDGVSYTVVATSTVQDGADLTMFQLSSTPALTALSIGNPGSGTAYMIGYGDADHAAGPTQTETWGTASVDATNYTLDLNGYSSTDFISSSTTYQVVNGDSGGGVFVYSPISHTYTLVGIMNATGTSLDGTTFYAYSVQLNAYLALINNVKAVPEPETYALMGMGAGLILLAVYRKRWPRCG